MIHQLDKTNYDQARPLFSNSAFHLALAAILAGNIPDAPVYVDDRNAPQTAVAWVNHRVYLAGNSQNANFNAALDRLFGAAYYPQARAQQWSGFVLHYTPEDWEDQIDVILNDRLPRAGNRLLFTCRARPAEFPLPEGFTAQPVGRALVENTRLQGRDALLEEMVSERFSVEDFLAQSFGYGLLHNETIIGWCLSEYNHLDQCEVGIAVAAAYRRRGLATAMAAAFIRQAQARQITRIGWHCRADNIPSAKLAQKLGFTLTAEYPVYYCAI